MMRQGYSVLLLASAMVALPFAGQAHKTGPFGLRAHSHFPTDLKSYAHSGVYPGAFCDHQRFRGYTAGGAFNAHSSNARTLTCPAVNNRPDINHISGYVDVVDRSANRDVSCTLKHQISWSSGYMTVKGRKRSSVGASEALQRLNFIPSTKEGLLGYDTDPRHNWSDRTSYYLECNVPPIFEGWIWSRNIDGGRIAGRFVSEIRQYFVGEWKLHN